MSADQEHVGNSGLDAESPGASMTWSKWEALMLQLRRRRRRKEGLEGLQALLH